MTSSLDGSLFRTNMLYKQSCGLSWFQHAALFMTEAPSSPRTDLTQSPEHNHQRKNGPKIRARNSLVVCSPSHTQNSPNTGVSMMQSR